MHPPLRKLFNLFKSLARHVLMAPIYLAREVVFAHFVLLVNLVTPKRRMDLINHRLTVLGQALGLPRYRDDTAAAVPPSSRPPLPPGQGGQGSQSTGPQ